MRLDPGATVQRLFRLVGLDVQRNSALWSPDSEFVKVLERISDRTLVTSDRCFMLYQFAKVRHEFMGSFAEVGVYRGGTAKLLASARPDVEVHLFDTFSGLPATTNGVDLLCAGDFRDTSLEAVRQFLGGCGNVVFHAGHFPETAAPLSNERFCLVHIDADLYESVRSALEFFYPRLVPNGVLVVDDYEWKECPGVKIALDEFLPGKSATTFIARRYQYVVIKP